MACAWLRSVLERLERLDVPLQAGVVLLRPVDVLLHAAQGAELEDVEHEDQSDHPGAGERHDPRHAALSLGGEDVRREEVDLTHEPPQGMARPTAVASTGSASACASSDNESCEPTLLKTRPGSTVTGIR